MKPDIKWLDDPQVFRVNQLPAHSDHCFYANHRELDRENSSLSQSLNGLWDFCYSVCADSRPAHFYEPDFDASGFDQIPVPGHIELAGYDKIQYINTMYPWEGHAYRRPAHSLREQNGCGMFSQASYNPVGSYRKSFDLEKPLLGKRVIIRLEGVEQAFFLWLNGSFVGYAEDSFTPSEFDLTPYIQERGNLLAVEVHKRSTAAFLEDQDFFRFFGIFRNVTLYAKPVMHVEDLWAKPRLLEDGTGNFSLEFTVSMPVNLRGRAEISLEDQDAKLLFRRSLRLETHAGSNENPPPKNAPFQQAYGEISCLLDPQPLGTIQPWEHNSPYLYRLLIRLYDRENHLVEIVPCAVGFYSLEIKDQVIRLNGQRLVLCGVNRHEWSMTKGRCIGISEMEQDMKLLLENHFNAVRTCHYPDQLPWYSLCDEKGIYVMAEANLESHGSWQKMGVVEPSWNVPGSLHPWREAVLDRIRSNFELLKNHPSILFWSLGNESYAGEVLACAHDWLKQKDDGRLIHYEGVFHNRSYEDRISHVESRMYAPPQEIRAYLENSPKKPFLLCEYMHDMGNSLGGMASYMQLLEDYESYHGGFIWDWIDQALLRTDPVTGKQTLCYGGDFDDRPSDYAFSGNGLLFADRREKPAMQEVRYYYGLWSKAGASPKNVSFPAPAPGCRTAWLPQINPGCQTASPPKEEPLRIVYGDATLGVHGHADGSGFHFIFSYALGGPESFVWQDREWLYRPPMPCFWRALTDNDRGCAFARRSGIWLAADQFLSCQEISVAVNGQEIPLPVAPENNRYTDQEQAGQIQITYTYATITRPRALVDVSYQVRQDGSLQVRVHYHGAKGLPELPVFGLRFLMPDCAVGFSYQGLSGETYPDRKAGGVPGIYEVEGLPVTPYLVPQDCGMHMDTSWVSVYRGHAPDRPTSVRFEAVDRPFAFSCLPYTPQELENATHQEELPPARRTVLTICGAVRGVGGIDSWGRDVEPAFHISGEEDLEFAFRICGALKQAPGKLDSLPGI